MITTNTADAARPAASATARLGGLVAGVIVFTAAIVLLSQGRAAAENIFDCNVNSAVDRYDDLLIGAPLEDVGRPLNAGAMHEMHGGPGGLTPVQTWHPPLGTSGQRFADAMTCGDFNGDGYGDIAIGSPEYSSERSAAMGRVEVIYGGPNGLISGTRPQQQITQDSPGMKDRGNDNDLFGFDLSACDFDGDGHTDLAVGVPGERAGRTRNAGAVQIIYGGPGGLTRRNQLIRQGSGISDAAETNDFFGSYLTSFDVDRDEHCDLVVGIALEDVGSVRNAGAVHVIYGGPTGLTTRDQFLHRNTPGVQGRARPGEGFGSSLFLGNFLGGPELDLVVGVPGQRVAGQPRSGAVHVLPAINGGGLTGEGDQVIHLGSPGVRGRPQRDAQFGRSLTAGRVDADELADLIVGAPGQNAGRKRSGAVHVIFGGGSQLSARTARVTMRSAGVTPQRNAYFGESLSAGDYNGDRLIDVAIGTPYFDANRTTPDSGAVFVFYGGGPRAFRPFVQSIFQSDFPRVTDVTPQEACDRFGTFNPAGLVQRPPAQVDRRCPQRER
jgi:hypothetical protein